MTDNFEQQLADLLAEASDRPPSEVFGDVPDDLWLWINTEGYRRSPAIRDLLPGLPEEEVQRRWTFRTGDDTLVAGFGIYLLVRDLYRRLGSDLRDAHGVLDFGCGYGRLIRFFLKDVDHRRLTGSDYNGSLIDFCRASNRWCEFVRNDAAPPLPFADGQFEYVFVHSVFSHFSEAMHLRWLEELRRTVRPGGAVAISVRPRNFIEALREMRDWSVNGESLVDTDRWRARYDAGEFCFSRYGPRSDPWWGEAVIPKTYIEREWSRFFEVVEFVEGTSPLKLEEPGRAPHPAAEQSFVLLRA